jgi:hypothetical protein
MNAIRTTVVTPRTASSGSGITFRRTTIDDHHVQVGRVYPYHSAGAEIRRAGNSVSGSGRSDAATTDSG